MDILDIDSTEHTDVNTLTKASKVAGIKIHAGMDWDPSTITGHEPTVADIPFEPGTFAAKQAFQKLWNHCHSPEAIAKAQNSGVPGCEDSNGYYAGKPLIKGPGPGQGDYQLMVDKIKITQGVDDISAEKIAGAIKNKLAGIR